MLKRISFGFAITLLMAGTVLGAHPLITDDTGTQGKGKFQVEVNSEFSFDREKAHGVSTKAAGGEVAAILSYGAAENIDLILGVPYQWFRVREDGAVVAKEEGLTDISLELKWRFFEKELFSLALKPVVTLPTGDEKRGLGSGRASYGVVFITTKEIEPWEFHLNLSYTHNEYKLADDRDANRKGIWHVSIASEYEVIKDLRLVANIGMERNSERSSNTHPAFILGGLVYSIAEDIDINLGVKGGLNKSETDLAGLAGIALRF